jgi:hypothetical protein
VKLDLLSHTPEVETLIATAMLTTTSGAKPSTLFRRLKENREKVKNVVEGLETQHGSILEHNRLYWVLEATEGEVLDILLDCRFFAITKLGDRRWLLSANLRTVVEFIVGRRDVLARALAKSVQLVAPSVHSCLRRGRL